MVATQSRLRRLAARIRRTYAELDDAQRRLSLVRHDPVIHRELITTR